MSKLKKFMFLFPLLTLSMWAIGAVPNIKKETFSSDNKIAIKGNSEKEFSHFITTQVAENDFVITELEPEFEVELEWYNSEFTTCFVGFLNIQNQSKLFYKPYFSTKETIPLYDLFCNWKFHLS